MDYQIVKLELESGTIMSGERKNEKWEGIRATMKENYDEDDVFSAEESREHVKMFFGEKQVEKLKLYLDDISKMPEKMRVRPHGFEVSVPLGGQYYRIYTKDVTDKATGSIIGRAGERRPDRNGDYVPVDTITVLAFKKRNTDEASDVKWYWAEDPEDIMKQLRVRYFRPVEAFDGEPKHATVVPGDAEPPVTKADAPDNDPLAGLSPEMLAKLRKTIAEQVDGAQS